MKNVTEQAYEDALASETSGSKQWLKPLSCKRQKRKNEFRFWGLELLLVDWGNRNKEQRKGVTETE